MGGAVNTRDFFHGKSALFFRSVKILFLTLLFFIPGIIMLIILVKPNEMLLLLGIVSMYIGLLLERWYFFADANHPQNIYYQTIG